MNKPEYRIPLISEIEQIPFNNYNIVSTFSGCGGSCLGFKLAGYRVLWANEFIRAAGDTYRANHPSVILEDKDIRRITGQTILDAIGLEQGQVDVLEGSPPCADFSTAGKRSGGINTVKERVYGKTKKYSSTTQPVDDLFYEFARILKELQSKVFVAENVKGLTTGDAKLLLGSPQVDMFGRHEDTIYHTLVNCGYNVRYKVLNAKFYGVPQSRERLIFIGIRNDLKLEPVYPIALDYIYCVADALPWIKSIVQENLFGQGDKITPAVEPSLTIKSAGYGGTVKYHVEANTSIEKYAIGAEWDKIEVGQRSEKYFNLVKPSLEKPCPTITQSCSNIGAASIVHPLEKRKFYVAELKRLSSFPDDFILTGNYQQQCERIGRAVPPLMMYHIAKTIKEQILDRL